MTPQDRGKSESVCALCDGAGETYEPCHCYQCEYDNSAHSRYVPCPDCHPEAYGVESAVERDETP